jgi:hypothetical protein
VTATVTSFPLFKHHGGGGATPAFSGQLVSLQFCEGLPLPPLGQSGHPTLFATCLIVVVVVHYSVVFLFFPWVGVGLSRRLC